MFQTDICQPNTLWWKGWGGGEAGVGGEGRWDDTLGRTDRVSILSSCHFIISRPAQRYSEDSEQAITAIVFDKTKNFCYLVTIIRKQASLFSENV